MKTSNFLAILLAIVVASIAVNEQKWWFVALNFGGALLLAVDEICKAIKESK